MPTSAPESSQVSRWIRAIDLVCLLLVVVALIIAMSGGFRLRVAGWRVALTSPLRILLWAIGIGLARHVLAPETPIHRDLPPRLARWARLPSVRSAGAVLLGTRPAILFVGYLAVFLFGYAGGRAPLRHFENELMNLPVRWDAGWYLRIVTDGYTFEPHDPGGQQSIVYFPAYPMLVRVVGRLLGGQLTSFVLAGVVVSLTAFFAALLYLYEFARDALDEDEARYALWLIAAYPFALFFGAIYTESLFLLGAVAAFCHFTRRQFWLAGAWGLLVGLTRPPGFLLCVPLGVLAISPWLPPLIVGGRVDKDAPPLRKSLVAAAMPAVGLLMFTAFTWRLTGDPLLWLSGHAAWGRQYVGISALVTTRVEFISRAGLYEYTAQLPYDLLNALGVVFVLAAVWPVARRLGLAYATFMLINILPPLAAGGLLSAGRLSSVLFPAFIWFAGAVPPQQRAGWLVTFVAIQALNAALFYTWRPLF